MESICSIIIPVYNVEKYLEACLNSLNDFKNSSVFEIIIVNDGSTDSSPNIITEWVQGTDNIKVINQTNAGLSAARNTGFKAATGKYIAFIDSDDYITAEKLKLLLHDALSSNADIAIGDFTSIYEDKDDVCLSSISIPAGEYDAQSFFIGNYKELMSVVWRSVYKKEFLESNNLSFHEGICFEDVEFTPIVFGKAHKVFYSKIPFYYYRKRNDSITTSNVSLKKVMDSIAVWETLCNESRSFSTDFSKICRELGFHVFLYQFSRFSSSIPSSAFNSAKKLSRQPLYTSKYKVLSVLMTLLPQSLFHKILSKLK